MHTFSETGAGVPAFLAKLWRLVEDPETNDLISWSTDGRSFIIQNQAQFAKELLPLNYKHNNMASFIRQLNMYGFHKITSIDNGGLRFDKDEMEFTHPCFQKDHPYLLEHIKRKIANSKQQQQQQQQQQQDDKSSTKVEAVNRVLSEMKNMRGRQDSLDSRFSTMKQENEALWREIAILRQKHMKQQQIVNKLIQFLVTIVQPSRGGLGSMNGNGNNKRRFQLMINDAPPTTPAKVKKTGGEGATIQELGEVLEEVAFENEQDLLTSEVPEVTSPISIAQQSPYRSDSVNEVIEEVTSPMSYYGGQQEQIAIKREHVDRTRRMTGPQEEEGGNVVDDGSYDDEGYLVDHVEEFEAGTSQLYNDSDMLVTPMVIKEMQKQQQQLKQMQQQQQQQQQQQKAVSKGESLLKIKKNGAIHKAQKSLLTNNKHSESNSGKKMHHVGVGKTISSNDQSGTSAAGPSGMGNFVTDSIPTTSIGYGMNDFIVNDQVPSDLFDDNDSQMEKESPMLGVGFNFDGGFYNPNVNINEMKGRQQQLLQQQQQQQQQPQSQAAGPSHESNLQADDEDDLNGGDESDKAGRTLASIDYGHHIDTVQTDLDSLKDLLKGEGYQFDANTLLGTTGGNGPQFGRVYFAPSAFDTDALNKLFAGNEDLLGYDFPMNLPDAASVSDAQKRNIAVGGAGGGAITAGVCSSNSASNGSGDDDDDDGLVENRGEAGGLLAVNDNSEKENDMPDNDTDADDDDDDEEGEGEDGEEEADEDGAEMLEDGDEPENGGDPIKHELFDNDSINSNDYNDDDLTSESFCSELYSSHTSSSFSPSISDGMTTPNSITNDGDHHQHQPGSANGGTADSEQAPAGQDKRGGHQHRRHHHHHHRSSSADNNNKIIKNNNHTNSHSKNNDGTYRCQFCDKTFPRLGYLKKHEQSHTEHMPFKCEYCARLFKHKRSRDRHTKLHTGDRRYRCPHCEAAFSRSDHLKIHMKTHDNQKPFQCTICNRGYNTAAALTSHMQNHKKQIALTGSPNLTYSPRSTSSLSSSASNPKRKFSPYEQNLMMINRSKLLKSGELTCIYCTRTDFANLEQLGAHVQTMHSNLLLNENNFHRMPTSPDALLSYPPISCEFCTMKFPTVPMMFNHLKTTHLDRINSPKSYLEQFNKNLMNTYTSFYGSSAFLEDKHEPNAEVKNERPSSEKSVRDENGNEEATAASPPPIEPKVIKQEKKDENDNSQDAADHQEQLAPTDLSQPRMKRLKLEHENHSTSSSSSRDITREAEKDTTPVSNLSTAPGAYLCNQCNAALPDFESFRTHLKAHLEQGSTASSFVCQQCGATLADQQEHEKHVTGHYLVAGAEYQCEPTCSKSFAKAEELHKHLYDSHTQVLYKCVLCGETFDTKVTIQVHFAVAHSNEVKLYRCSACAEVFRAERDFRHHIRTRHITSGAVQCVFCRVVCTSELEMQFHLAAHARKFKCPACPESFHVEFLLDRHMQTHHSQKEISNAAAAGASNTTVNNQPTNSTNLDYLQLHGQMAAAAAAANWQNLYAANKFYNPLHVDTLNPIKHPNFLHGFYDSLNKSHAQRYLDQSKKGFVSPNNNNNNSQQSKAALLNLYNQQRSAAMNGLYSPDHNPTSQSAQTATNAAPATTNKSPQIYSPTALLHRYGLNSSGSGSGTTANSNNGSALAVAAPEKATSSNTKNNTVNYYSCGICERTDFSTENEVQTHRKIVHNLKTGVSLRCAYCSGDFRSRNELENHMKIAHNTGGKHKCLICDEIFPSPAVLAEHKLTHCKVGASGRCSHCPTTLPDVHSFKAHLSQHIQPASATSSTSSTGKNESNGTSSSQEQERFPIQCICCRQTLNSEFEISLHAKFHTKSSETNEKTCALCLEPLANGQDAKICESCLKRHNFPSKLLSINNFIKSSSNSTAEDPTSHHHQHHPPPTLSQSPAQCNLCKKHLYDGQKLQEHLIDHTFAGCEDRGFVCYLCSSVFTSSGGLQTHMDQHGPQAKPYDCNHCDEAFFFRAELEHHLIDHELGKVHLPAAFVQEEHARTSPPEIKPEIVEAIVEKTTPADADPESGSEQEGGIVAGEEPEVTEREEGEEDDEEVADDDDEYIEVEHNVEESAKEDRKSIECSQ